MVRTSQLRMWDCGLSKTVQTGLYKGPVSGMAWLCGIMSSPLCNKRHSFNWSFSNVSLALVFVLVKLHKTLFIFRQC